MRTFDQWKEHVAPLADIDRGEYERIQSDARADDLKCLKEYEQTICQQTDRIEGLERHLNRANASIKMLVQQSNDAIAKSAELERENTELKEQQAIFLHNGGEASVKIIQQGEVLDSLRAQLAVAQGALRLSHRAIEAFYRSVKKDSDNYVGGIERCKLDDALKACEIALSTPPAASLETVVEALRAARKRALEVDSPSVAALLDKALAALGIQP